MSKTIRVLQGEVYKITTDANNTATIWSLSDGEQPTRYTGLSASSSTFVGPFLNECEFLIDGDTTIEKDNEDFETPKGVCSYSNVSSISGLQTALDEKLNTTDFLKIEPVGDAVDATTVITQLNLLLANLRTAKHMYTIEAVSDSTDVDDVVTQFNLLLENMVSSKYLGSTDVDEATDLTDIVTQFNALIDALETAAFVGSGDIADATDLTDIVTQFNALLADLRSNGYLLSEA